MDHHPHLHAIVPGGGPAIEGSGWMVSRHPTQRHRRKPYLTNNVELGRLFRKKFVRGFRRLVRAGRLKLQEEWAVLKEPGELDAWLDKITASDWNVFIAGPPHGKSRPERVLKYLARYLTGGPISDSRMLAEENGRVTFLARSKNKATGNRPRPFTLPGKEFVRRWSMHILPKGYTRSRCFGGYHGTKRKDYLHRCQESLEIGAFEGQGPKPADLERSPPKCPRCDIAMHCIEQHGRPSWKILFDRRIYEDKELYSPMHHICSRAPPAFPGKEDS